ncbi:MAG: hypothetical protein ACLP7F_15255, partial [Acidimicrobiales bacterium]
MAVAVALASMTYVGSVMVASATGPRIRSNAEYLVAVRQAVGFAAGPVHDSGWVAYRSGGVAAYGGARRLGPAPTGFGPVRGIASNPRGRGFWLFNANGTVAAFGNARTHPGPVPMTTTVGMASSATGQGYLLLDAAGNVYPYGDAVFYGEAPGRLGPFRQIVATPDHKGYWLLSSTGRVYGFGDAHTYGPRVGHGHGAGSFVALAPAPDGHGYWEATAAGVVRGYGDARQVTAAALAGLVALIPSASGRGYTELDANGGLFVYGAGPALVADYMMAPQTVRYPARRVTHAQPTTTSSRPVTTAPEAPTTTVAELAGPPAGGLVLAGPTTT